MAVRAPTRLGTGLAQVASIASFAPVDHGWPVDSWPVGKTLLDARCVQLSRLHTEKRATSDQDGPAQSRDSTGATASRFWEPSGGFLNGFGNLLEGSWTGFSLVFSVCFFFIVFSFFSFSFFVFLFLYFIFQFLFLFFLFSFCSCFKLCLGVSKNNPISKFVHQIQKMFMFSNFAASFHKCFHLKNCSQIAKNVHASIFVREFRKNVRKF